MNFVLFRHGHSIANQESRIVSSLDHGTQGFGLSARGKEEVAESAKTLAYHIIASTLTPQKHPTRVQIVTSPFKRTLETASIIHEHLLSAFSTSRVLADENKKIVLGAKVDVVQDLRERFFGEFDMKTPSDHLYNIVWEADGANPFHEQYGVESVSAVTERVTGVIRSLEKQYHKTAKLEDREQKATDLTKAELESTEQEDVELENEKLEADQEDPEQRKEET
ncbi:hypothetical protein FBU30_006175 [Linnemannia zychae]|nr:hypothetical protein FBU30_006175 [Linnemannia zychae]